jgi:hypothetical protein
MLIRNYLIKNYLCTYTIDKNKGHYTYSLLTNFISELDNLGMGLGMLLEHGAGHFTPSIASMLLLLKKTGDSFQIPHICFGTFTVFKFQSGG